MMLEKKLRSGIQAHRDSPNLFLLLPPPRNIPRPRGRLLLVGILVGFFVERGDDAPDSEADDDKQWWSGDGLYTGTRKRTK